MYSSFGREIALARQAHLLHEAGVDNPAAPMLADLAARKRAEVRPSPILRMPISPGARLAFALADYRRSLRLAGA